MQIQSNKVRAIPISAPDDIGTKLRRSQSLINQGLSLIKRIQRIKRIRGHSGGDTYIFGCVLKGIFAARASVKRTFIQTSVKDTESIWAWPLVSLLNCDDQLLGDVNWRSISTSIFGGAPILPQRCVRQHTVCMQL